MKLNTVVMCAAVLLSAAAYGVDNGAKKEFDPASINKLCGLEFGISETKGIGVGKQVKLEKAFRYLTTANCFYKEGFLHKIDFEGPMPKDWTPDAWNKETKACMDIICKKFNIPENNVVWHRDARYGWDASWKWTGATKDGGIKIMVWREDSTIIMSVENGYAWRKAKFPNEAEPMKPGDGMDAL